MSALDHACDLVYAEVMRQDEIHPDGYPASRDGIRLGLASAEDELLEAKKAWRSERRIDGWLATEEELAQLAAVAVRTLRSLVEERAKEALAA